MPGAAWRWRSKLHPFVFAAAGLDSQGVFLFFDGARLGPEQRVEMGTRTWTWVIPADLWNATVGTETGGVLEFVLRDAASPAALDRTGRNDDTRMLGVGVSRVRFRVVPVSPKP